MKFSVFFKGSVYLHSGSCWVKCKVWLLCKARVTYIGYYCHVNSLYHRLSVFGDFLPDLQFIGLGIFSSNCNCKPVMLVKMGGGGVFGRILPHLYPICKSHFFFWYILVRQMGGVDQ